MQHFAHCSVVRRLLVAGAGLPPPHAGRELDLFLGFDWTDAEIIARSRALYALYRAHKSLRHGRVTRERWAAPSGEPSGRRRRAQSGGRIFQYFCSASLPCFSSPSSSCPSCSFALDSSVQFDLHPFSRAPALARGGRGNAWPARLPGQPRGLRFRHRLGRVAVQTIVPLLSRPRGRLAPGRRCARQPSLVILPPRPLPPALASRRRSAG